jgi:hypothetical protein
MKGGFYIQTKIATASNSNACGGAVNLFHPSADLFFFWLQPILISSKTTFTPPQEKNLSLTGNEKSSQPAKIRAHFVKSSATFDKNSATLDENSATLDENSATFDENSATFDENSATLDENSATLDENSATFDENSATFDENSAHFVESSAHFHGAQVDHNSLRVLYITQTTVNN